MFRNDDCCRVCVYQSVQFYPMKSVIIIFHIHSLHDVHVAIVIKIFYTCNNGMW